jgi:hypothetical protein
LAGSVRDTFVRADAIGFQKCGGPFGGMGRHGTPDAIVISQCQYLPFFIVGHGAVRAR